MLLQPIFLHQNLVPTAADRNDLWALGTGIKYSINDIVSFTSEYIYRFPQNESPTFDQHYNSFSLGMAFVTHGHYFSLHVTNSNALYESGYLAQTFDSWKQGDIRLGFNIIRNFKMH